MAPGPACLREEGGAAVAVGPDLEQGEGAAAKSACRTWRLERDVAAAADRGGEKVRQLGKEERWRSGDGVELHYHHRGHSASTWTSASPPRMLSLRGLPLPRPPPKAWDICPAPSPLPPQAARPLLVKAAPPPLWLGPRSAELLEETPALRGLRRRPSGGIAGGGGDTGRLTK
ncbi:hypothetical protein E2562_035221 [Oryza meyeriana var. granulata]|uniref:Uncharacterized protein n=1 Tax=Oryza meyeriana var. granulata TaxID=110450 RepID=A0A6G1DS78_9ORYZ|nr:hypothetical protein E2562_035221 [Oryza meyeriana var. granulata]